MGKKVFLDLRYPLGHRPAHVAYAPADIIMRYLLTLLPSHVGMPFYNLPELGSGTRKFKNAATQRMQLFKGRSHLLGVVRLRLRDLAISVYAAVINVKSWISVSVRASAWSQARIGGWINCMGRWTSQGAPPSRDTE